MKKYSRLLDELKKRLEDIQEPSFELPETSVGQPYVEKTVRRMHMKGLYLKIA